MLNWQVGRVKVTRIVEMDLPVPAEVFAEATPAALAAGIAHLMRDAPAREAIRRAGAAAVQGNTWDRNWAATRRIYEEILAPARL